MTFNYCPDCGTHNSVEQLDNTAYKCSNCGWLFWNNAKGATALAFVKDGKLLVVERGREPHKGEYELAGGFVDYGENPYETAIRETKEELGVEISRDDLQLIDVYHNDYMGFATTIDVAFLITNWKGDIGAHDDVANVSWKPLEFINDESFCQKHYTGLDKAIKKKLGL